MKSFFTLSAALLLFGLRALAGNEPVLSVGDVSLEVANVLLPIDIQTQNVAVAAMQFDILYDSSLLTVGLPQAGTAFTDHVVTASQVAPGQLRVVVDSMTNAALRSDVLIELPIAPVAAGEADPVLTLANLMLSGADGTSITPDVAPSVRLLGLTDKQSINGLAGLRFTATATTSEQGDTISSVAYYVDGKLVGQGTGSDFGFTWTPPGSGQFKVLAVASDSNGNTADSRVIPVIITGVGTTPVSAKYVGLVEEDTPVPATSGTIHMSTTPKGLFTGKLTIGGVAYPLHGTFDTHGVASEQLTTKAKTTLTVSLQLDAVPLKNEIQGTVTDGTFTSQIVADHAPWDGRKTKAPWAGRYTLALPPDPLATDATYPQGTGVATVQVSATGTVIAAGSLADGTPFAQGASLSQDGNWPFFVSLSKGAGMVIGPLQFEDVPAVSDLDGTLAWSRPITTTGLFRAGIEETIPALGSAYTPPAVGKRALALPNLIGNAEFIAGGTDALSKIITLSSANTLAPIAVGTDKLTLKFTPTVGKFAGTFIPAAGAAKVNVTGVLLQKQNMGVGVYTGVTAEGGVSLAVNPQYASVAVAGGGENNDRVAPLLAIKAPAANAKFVSPAKVTFSGTSSDKAGVTAVEYQVLHNGVLTAVETASGTAAWTLTLTPADLGSYTVFVKAIDKNGNETGLVSRSFTYLAPK